MATGIVTGTMGTASITAGTMVRDVSDKIFLLENDAAPLTAISSKLNKKVSYNYKFEWYEDVLQPDWDTINHGAGYIATDTSIVVSNGAYFNIYDIVKVPRTGEIMLVTNVVTNTLTVVRHYGTTVAASLVDTEPLAIIGNALEEGANPAGAKATRKSGIANYCQPFSKTVDLTDVEDKVKLYGGADRALQRKKKGIEFMRDIEKAFLFGEPLEDTGTMDTSLVQPRRTTGGLLYFAAANYTDASGVLTEAEFNGFLRDGFYYGSSTKYLFASPLVLSVINQFAQGKLQTRPEDKLYGLNIQTYVCPFGEVKLIQEKQFKGAIYGGYGILCDMGEIVYRYLDGLDMQLRTDIQSPDAHKVKDEYYGHIGLEIHNPEKFRILKGVTS